MKPCGRCK